MSESNKIIINKINNFEMNTRNTFYMIHNQQFSFQIKQMCGLAVNVKGKL